LFIYILSATKLLIINAKIGDKLIISKTDATIKDYSNLSEQKDDSNEKKSQDSKNVESDEKMKADSRKESMLPCIWKFSSEKANNEQYIMGHRILLTYHKVNFEINIIYYQILIGLCCKFYFYLTL
jgi:hypothetical protein